MKSAFRITEDLEQTASSFDQQGFTTKDFIDHYQVNAPDEWRALASDYGWWAE
jgi:hypothetical protein